MRSHEEAADFHESRYARRGEDGAAGGRENANGPIDARLVFPETPRHFKRHFLNVPATDAAALSLSTKTAFPPFRSECFA